MTVDGRPAGVYKVDGAFRGVVVSAGTHRVVLRYRPPDMTTALWLAGLGLAALAGLAVAGLLGRRG